MNAWEIFNDVVTNKYADFEGRARRREYWTFILIQLLILLVLAFSSYLIGETISSLIFILFKLALLIPGLALTVRRLHDTGRSGWMMLINLIPIIGSLILLYFFLSDSQEGDNEYGPNPKTGATDNDYLFDDLGK